MGSYTFMLSLAVISYLTFTERGQNLSGRHGTSEDNEVSKTFIKLSQCPTTVVNVELQMLKDLMSSCVTDLLLPVA